MLKAVIRKLDEQQETELQVATENLIHFFSVNKMIYQWLKQVLLAILT